MTDQAFQGETARAAHRRCRRGRHSDDCGSAVCPPRRQQPDRSARRASPRPRWLGGPRDRATRLPALARRTRPVRRRRAPGGPRRVAQRRTGDGLRGPPRPSREGRAERLSRRRPARRRRPRSCRCWRRRRVGSAAVQTSADHRQRLADRLVLLRRDREHLRRVGRMFWDDHQDSGSSSLDIELDAAQSIERDIEIEAIRARRDHQSLVGHQDDRFSGPRLDVDRLARVKQPPRTAGSSSRSDPVMASPRSR